MMVAKIVPKTALGTLGCSDALENVLEGLGVAVLPPHKHAATVAWARKVLWEMANGLVREINRTVGEDALYLMECLGTWLLYGRPTEEDVDKLLLCGGMEVEDLTRLACRLQKGMEALK